MTEMRYLDNYGLKLSMVCLVIYLFIQLKTNIHLFVVLFQRKIQNSRSFKNAMNTIVSEDYPLILKRHTLGNGYSVE